MVKAFFHSSFLLKSLNHTFLTLIPKITTPELVTQFRPISLCNVTYKIIAKIMVNRLKPFMDGFLSGQTINLDKSELYCSPNMTTTQKNTLANALQVKLVDHPGKYLGITFKLRGSRIADFQDIIYKVSSKLQGWKAKLLSQAERLTLINSVLHSIPIYNFSVFKVPKHICHKLDSIINAFWWGHDPEKKKLHMTNWEKITLPKSRGGLGIKKFSTMNKALIAKQYWRICSHPNLLLTKTLKAKYCPNEDLHTHKPKSHASWIWKSIMGSNNPILTQGRWRVGNGSNIPLNHPLWYQTKPDIPNHIRNQAQTVTDLIDPINAHWKSERILQLYDYETSQQILSIPLSKVAFHSLPDKIIWPHSTTGEYQVKQAYQLLHQSAFPPHSHNGGSHNIWKHLWKIPLPHKILTFTWKLLQNALPIKTELVKRGIQCDPKCQLCHSENESSTHLFMQCHFARAVWLGVDITTRPLIENQITIQHWIQNLITGNSPPYALKLVLTTLWCIWFHRNQVTFEGKTPNPLETVLTSQSFLNRYNQQLAITHQQPPLISSSKAPRPKYSKWHIDTNWQLMILTAGGSKYKRKWQGTAFIGRNREGKNIFVGCRSTTLKCPKLAQATAIRDAVIQALNLGFTNIIILTDSNIMEQMWEEKTNHNWQVSPLFADIKAITQQHAIQLHIRKVTAFILTAAKDLASYASKYFVNVFNVPHV
jgi:ribonuclease HI